MELLYHIANAAVLTGIALLWARWARLDLGLRAPAYRIAEPWVLLSILWSTAMWAIDLVRPVGIDADYAARIEQLSLAEDLAVSVLLAPLCEELLFRGAMFAALLRRWGPKAAVLVPSLIWGLLHVQYDWWTRASIAGAGVLLAMIRWKSGSILLPLGLHALENLLLALDDHGWLGSAD